VLPLRAHGRRDLSAAAATVTPCDHGVFDCADVVDGRPVPVRFEWRADATTPVWQQSFSLDDGAAWTLNWVMSFRRATDAPAPDGLGPDARQ